MLVRFRKSFVAAVALACSVLIGAGCGDGPSGVAIRTQRARATAVHSKVRCDAACHAAFDRLHEIQVWTFMMALIPRIPYDAGMWYRLNACEEGGNWYADGYNAADPGHQHFQGGLGMSTVAWQMGRAAAAARGVWLPETALGGMFGPSTIDQQMQGAQAFLDANGWGWACPRT